MAGYEPTSAVSQNSTAASAMYGSQQPNQALGYAGLQQQRQLAQQGMAADERRAGEDMERFYGGMGMQREQFGAQIAENKERRSHEMKMQQDSQRFQQDMQNRALENQKNLKIAELEFAKAGAVRREQLAPQILKMRQDAANDNGKIAAYKVLETRGKEALTENIGKFTEFRDTQRKVKEKETEIGARSANAALARFNEDLRNGSAENKKTIYNLFGDNPFFGISTGAIDVEGDYGYDLLKPNDDMVDYVGDEQNPPDPNRPTAYGRAVLKTLDKLTGNQVGVAEESTPMFVSVDDDAVNRKSQSLLSTNVARAIAEQTGGNVPAEQIRQVVDRIIQGGDQPGDQAVLLGMLQEAGVSPEVMRSALNHFADAMDGTDKSSFNRQMIREQIDAAPAGSPKRMALEATLKMIDSSSSKARTAAAHLPGFDLSELDSAINYLQAAASGSGRVDRNELANFVGLGFAGRQDDDLRDAILSDTRLGELEGMGTDPLGQIRRNLGSLVSQQDKNALGIAELERLYKEDSSTDIDTLLNALRNMR
jgi:hypothetical protein